MKIDGACMCGYLRYEAEIDPEQVMICHCADCQNSTGAYRTGVLVDIEKFRLLSGTPRVYLKTAESGSTRAISFCPECGTQLHGAHLSNPKNYSLRLGTARQHAELVPRLQIWVRSAMPWTFDLYGIPQIETQPGIELALPADQP